MLKVLHVTNNYPTSQYPIFGIFVKEQINSLDEGEITNKVFFINGREKGKFEYLRAISQLRKLLENNHYDIIHCHHALSAFCLILSKKNKNNKVIVSYQSDPSTEQGKLLFNIIRNNTTAIILKNNSKYINNKTIFNLPNGVDIKFFLPIDKKDACEKINLDPSKTYILFVSSNFIRKEKRYDRFCSVIRILKNKYKMNGIEELLLVNTKRELVPYYFNAASLHLLTSDFEGSPNSVKEAMACNLSVVATNVGNSKQLLTNVNGSYISSSDNPDELAKLAYRSLTFSGNRNAREMLIKKKLDIDSIAEKLAEIYKMIK